MTKNTRAADPSRALVPVCFFLSGAAGLALEVVWSKYLSLLLGNSVHGIATVVAAFLGGLGLGAALAGRRAAKLRNPLYGYAMLEGVVGILALASPFAYQAARPLFSGLYEALGGAGPVLPSDLPESIWEAAPPGDLGAFQSTVSGAKRQSILQAYQQSGGDYKAAAKLLGLNPTYLLRLVRNLGLREMVKK